MKRVFVVILGVMLVGWVMTANAKKNSDQEAVTSRLANSIESDTAFEKKEEQHLFEIITPFGSINIL